MVSVYGLKPKFQHLLRPTVNKLAGLNVTPNQITIVAILISFAGGTLIFLFPEKNWPFLLIPILLLLRMALNAIDGMLAREHNMQTPLGAMLNEIGDVLSDAALYLPVGMIDGINPSLVVVVVILAIISEMTGVIAAQIGAQRRYDGPMGKSDRALVFALIGLVLGLGYAIELWINYLMMILIVLISITIINRARHALREIQ